jgi:hypothetical protein
MMTAGVEGARRGGPDAERKREYEQSLIGMREDFSPCDQEFDVTVDMMGGLRRTVIRCSQQLPNFNCHPP